MTLHDELNALENFAKNTKTVSEELYRLLQQNRLERKIQDANWRFGDMSIMCDEIVAQCEELRRIL